MKTKILMSVILGAMTVMGACNGDDEFNQTCQANPFYCLEYCLANPGADECSDSRIKEFPELKKAMDSLRAVSNLPIRE